MVRAAALAFLGALTMAGNAGAQTSTTTCGWETGRWVCRTPQERAPSPLSTWQPEDFSKRYDDAYERSRRLREAYDAQDFPTPDPSPPIEAPRPHVVDIIKDGQAEVLRLRVATAIREHRCGDAKELALQAGDLDMAEQAQRLCTP